LDRLFIRHAVTVKARVTPDLKKRLAADIQESLKRLDIEIGQLDFQHKRLVFDLRQKQESGTDSDALRQLEAEKQKRLAQRSELLQRLKEIAKLEDGTLVVQGAADAISMVEVGFDWDELARAEIVIEDGKVVGIRGGSKST